MVRRYFSMGMVCLHNLEAIKLVFLSWSKYWGPPRQCPAEVPESVNGNFCEWQFPGSTFLSDCHIAYEAAG